MDHVADGGRSRAPNDRRQALGAYPLDADGDDDDE